MKKDISEYLAQLDMSKNEVQVYLTLLKTGPVTMGALAKAVDLPRSTAYGYINLLMEKELVMKVMIGFRTKIAAIEPEKVLPHLVKQKIQADKEMQDNLPRVLNTLRADFPSDTNKVIDEAQIKFYKGKQGVKKIYEEVLQAQEQRSYVDTTKIAEFFPENFQSFNDAFMRNPQMKMFEIFQNPSNNKVETYLKLITKHKNYFYKILPEGVTLTAQDIMIYDNKVAIISFTNGTSGVVLQNPDLYNNFKALFDVMWKLLPNNSSEQKK